MLTAQHYSLLIPTFNRPRLLEALIEHLSNKRAAFPIYILDSSSEESKVLNKEIAARFASDIRYREFAPKTRFDEKIRAVLPEIESSYVSLCADDDIVFPTAVEDCISEMDRDPELALCHGIYLNLAVTGTAAKLTVEYSSPSIDANGPIERVCQLLTQYEALNYAVYRRTIMAETMNAISQFPETMFWELLSAVVPSVLGKVKRLPAIYYIRRSHGRPPRDNSDPVTWIAADPDQFLSAFCEYRERLFAYLAEKGVPVDPNRRKILTQAHIVYACRELRDGSSLQRVLAERGSPVGRFNQSKSLIGSRHPFIIFLADALRKHVGRYLTGAETVKFRADQIPTVAFESSPNVRALLSSEMISDMAHMISGLRLASNQV